MIGSAERLSAVTVVAEAVAHVPATCGELLQGVDADGPVLVSLPIELMGTVEVALIREPVIAVVPHRPRAHVALQKLWPQYFRESALACAFP